MTTHEQAARVLLYRLRKQMNGAALDTMRYYGRDYGRNYGVQIYALRDMARQVGTNHELAQYLYEQDVRELQIMALWMADPQCVDSENIAFWLSGIRNSELAEQASHALLSRCAVLDCALANHCANDQLICYALLLAAARVTNIKSDVVVEAVRSACIHFEDSALVGRAAANLLASLPEGLAYAEQLPDNPTARLVREELSWR